MLVIDVSGPSCLPTTTAIFILLFQLPMCMCALTPACPGLAVLFNVPLGERHRPDQTRVEGLKGKGQLKAPCRRQAGEETGVSDDVGDGTDQSPFWFTIARQAHAAPMQRPQSPQSPCSARQRLPMAHLALPFQPTLPTIPIDSSHQIDSFISIHHSQPPVPRTQCPPSSSE